MLPSLSQNSNGSTEYGVIGRYDICVRAWRNRWHACNNSSSVFYS